MYWENFPSVGRGNFVIISPPLRGCGEYVLSRPKNDAGALLSGLNISCPSSLSIERLLTDDFSDCSPVLGYRPPEEREHTVGGFFVYRSVPIPKYTQQKKYLRSWIFRVQRGHPCFGIF